MRVFTLLAVTAMVFAAGCQKKHDNSDMTSPPADTSPTTPAEPAPSPTPSETPPPPDTNNQQPPAEGTTTPPPNQ